MNKRPTTNPPRPFKFTMRLSDLADDTAYLSPDELGCYVRLLFGYWRNGPPRDDDRLLARIVGLAPDEWIEIRPTIEPLFDVLHGQWIHWRLDEELEAAYDAINKASRAGKVAARARWDKARGCDRNADRNAIASESHDDAAAMRSQCESQFQHEVNNNATSNASKTRPPKVQAKAMESFEDDVRIAERDLGIGGGK